MCNSLANADIPQNNRTIIVLITWRTELSTSHESTLIDSNDCNFIIMSFKCFRLLCINDDVVTGWVDKRIIMMKKVRGGDPRVIDRMVWLHMINFISFQNKSDANLIKRYFNFLVVGKTIFVVFVICEYYLVYSLLHLLIS